MNYHNKIIVIVTLALFALCTVHAINSTSLDGRSAPVHKSDHYIFRDKALFLQTGYVTFADYNPNTGNYSS